MSEVDTTRSTKISLGGPTVHVYKCKSVGSGGYSIYTIYSIYTTPSSLALVERLTFGHSYRVEDRLGVVLFISRSRFVESAPSVRKYYIASRKFHTR